MANVQVTGIPREMPGLKGAMNEFNKHHAEVADALLNVAGVGTVDGKMADVEDPRPPYVHKAWPAMGYHPDGREETAMNPEEAKELEAKGFRMRQPYPKEIVAVEDPKAVQARLIKEAADARATNAQLLEVIAKLNERMDVLEAEKKAAAPVPSKSR